MRAFGVLRLASVLLLTILVVVLGAGSASAKRAGTVDKVTGEFMYTRPAGTSWWDLAVHESAPAKGYVHLSRALVDGSEPEVLWAVRYVSIRGNEAWFAGVSIFDNLGTVGSWTVFHVVDTGGPADDGDLFQYTWRSINEDQARIAVETWMAPDLMRSTAFDEGNVTIHAL